MLGSSSDRVMKKRRMYQTDVTRTRSPTIVSYSIGGKFTKKPFAFTSMQAALINVNFSGSHVCSCPVSINP